MIDKVKTLEKFGYEVDSLSLGNKKKVCMTCDDCGKEVDRAYHDLLKARKRFEADGVTKDTCTSCGKKKGYEIAKSKGLFDDKMAKMVEKSKKTSMEKFGYEHANQRPENVEKTKERWANMTQEQKDERLAKVVETNLERFGCEFPGQSDAVKQKTIETNLKKYGTPYGNQNEEVRAKINATNAAKYEGGHIFATKEFIEKNKIMLEEKKEQINKAREITMLERFGVTNPTLNPEIAAKISSTYHSKTDEEKQTIQNNVESAMLEKYGVKSVFQLEEVKERIKQTNLILYGCENPMQNEEVQERACETNLERYGFRASSQNEEVKAKIKEAHSKYEGGHFKRMPESIEKQRQWSIDNYEKLKTKRIQTSLEKYGTEHPMQNQQVKESIYAKRLENGSMRKIDGMSVRDYCLNHEISSVYAHQLINKGIDPNLYEKHLSFIETSIKNILIKNEINFVPHPIVNGRKGDFLVDNRILIECDGLYWHSDEIIEDKRYHQIKRATYIESGLQPLFFREDEIINKSEIVESIILNKYGVTNRIFARKCSIIEGTTQEANQWFEANHLMGKGQGRVFFLVYNTEKVCAIQIKNRKANELFEVSRFAPRLNTSITGGFSKLISHVEKTLHPKELMTYIDLRYGSGSYLTSLGFEYCGEYISFVWTRGGKAFHRMTFPGNSGYDNGFAKLWDCGQAKYTKKY